MEWYKQVSREYSRLPFQSVAYVRVMTSQA